MVDLAVVPPVADTQATDLAAVANARTTGPDKEVQIESGVGLFQAFDVATAPGEGDSPAGAARAESNEADPAAEAGVLPSSTDAPPADTSVSLRKTADGQADESNGPLPAVALAALMATTDTFHLEEVTERRPRRTRLR
jgi:hypothetical protein